jgi:glycogen operon protein
MLANGTPMLRAGDEFLQTQGGNNNPYNQDNETTWLDWDRLHLNEDMFRFVKGMIAFRKAHPSIARSRFWRDDVDWFGPAGPVDPNSCELAYRLRGASEGDCDLFVMVNASPREVGFRSIPAGVAWRLAVDTGAGERLEIREPGSEPVVAGGEYRVLPHSVVVLLGRNVVEEGGSAKVGA